MPLLTPRDIEVALRRMRHWTKKSSTIAREFQFPDFPTAIRFVNRVARLAEKAWHHPDIDIRWNKVRLTLTTHDQGGLTERDFVLADRLNQAYDAVLSYVTRKKKESRSKKVSTS